MNKNHSEKKKTAFNVSTPKDLTEGLKGHRKTVKGGDIRYGDDSNEVETYKTKGAKLKKFIFVIQDMSWLYDHKAQFSLGIMYLSTKMKEAGVEIVEIFDTNDHPIEEIPEADAYGYSAMYNTYQDSIRTAKIIKERYPDAPLLIGGVHATLDPTNMDPIFDSVFVGEAEDTIQDYIRDFGEGACQKIYYRTDVVNIDDLMPDRKCVTENYIRTSSIFAGGDEMTTGGATTVMFSRGCPFLCSFCSSPNFWGRKVRYRPIEHIVKEIKHLRDDWGIRQFRIQDDTFTLNYKFIKGLAAALKPLGIYYRCSTRVDTLCKHDDFSQLLWDSGCREVGMGIEVADDWTLKRLQKAITVEQMYKAVEQVRKFPIKIRFFFLIGTPYDTYETMQKNIEFIENTKPDALAVGNLIAFPGDDMYIRAEHHGIKAIKEDTCMNIGQHLDLRPNIERYDISEEEHLKIMRVFYDYLVEKGYLAGLFSMQGNSALAQVNDASDVLCNSSTA